MIKNKKKPPRLPSSATKASRAQSLFPHTLLRTIRCCISAAPLSLFKSWPAATLNSQVHRQSLFVKSRSLKRVGSSCHWRLLALATLKFISAGAASADSACVLPRDGSPDLEDLTRCYVILAAIGHDIISVGQHLVSRCKAA